VSVSFGAFLSGVPAGAPVVCFGSRSAPGPVLAVARGVGAAVARSGRPVFSGGARGCDSAFVAGARGAGGSGVVFRPLPGSGVPGLFARSERALRVARARGGVAVVFLPASAFAAVRSGRPCPGGSAWSARCSLRLGVPLLLVGFGLSGSSTTWCYHYFAGSSPTVSCPDHVDPSTGEILATSEQGSASPLVLALSKCWHYISHELLGPPAPYAKHSKYGPHHVKLPGKRTLTLIRVSALALFLVITLASAGVIPTTDFHTRVSYNQSSSDGGFYTDYYGERR